MNLAPFENDLSTLLTLITVSIVPYIYSLRNTHYLEPPPGQSYGKFKHHPPCSAPCRRSGRSGREQVESGRFQLGEVKAVLGHCQLDLKRGHLLAQDQQVFDQEKLAVGHTWK